MVKSRLPGQRSLLFAVFEEAGRKNISYIEVTFQPYAPSNQLYGSKTRGAAAIRTKGGDGLNNGQEDQIRRAQAGDSEAFIQLVKGLERQMYSMAKSIVRNDEDCADIMQETVMKAYKALSGLKEPAFFNTWLFRILINECNMILRRRDRVIVMPEPPEHLLISSSFGGDMDLRNAVNRLEEISRTIVILHYYQGLTLQEIAGLLELSESAVKTRLHRARKTLYESLAEPAERKMNG